MENFTVAKLNCNSLENICGWMVVLHGQDLLHRLFHWKSFAVTDWSTKTVKLFHLEQFAMYGIRTSCFITKILDLENYHSFNYWNISTVKHNSYYTGKLPYSELASRRGNFCGLDSKTFHRYIFRIAKQA